MKKNKYNYKIGDKITILSEPFFWSSYFSNKCPLGGVVEFPYRCIIADIDYDDSSFVDNNGYGWCLSTLLNTGLILNIKHIRKQKLNIISGLKT